MIREAIILAGGFGTRLQSVVSDKPKAMAAINNRPFLEIMLAWLEKKGIERVILALGYKADAIVNHFGEGFRSLKIEYSIEGYPLGTGGALKKAFKLAKGASVFALNGDTLFDVDFEEMAGFHEKKQSSLTIALKKSADCARSGSVALDSQNRITRFDEKKFKKSALISGGVYIIKTSIFEGFEPGEKFSFECDFIERFCREKSFYGLAFDGFFIDIGIPEEYSKAQVCLSDFR